MSAEPSDSAALRARYADLLGDAPDPAAVRLIGDLDVAYTPVPVPATLAAAAAQPAAAMAQGAIATPDTQHAKRPRLSQRRPLFAAVALLVLATLLASGAYAVRASDPHSAQRVMDRTFAMDTGAERVLRAGLVHEVKIEQSRAGFTVTLRRVYADANRVLLGYTISGPEGVTVRSYGGFVRSSLTDGQGHPLPSLGGEGSAIDAGVQGMLTASDTVRATTADGMLTLHWHADALRVNELSGPPAASDQSPLAGLAGLARPLERLRASRVTVAMAQPGPARGEVVIPGPFDFVVSVPVVAGHVANLQQTISAAGIPVTLERVVVTPSQTRAYLRFPATQGIPAKHWYADIRFTTGGWDSHQPPRGREGGGLVAGDEYEYNVDNAPANPLGAWTVTVDQLSGVDIQAFDPQQGPRQVRLAGPWVFHAEMR